MTRSYLSIDPEHSTITNYSMASKGARSIVKLEIAVTDADELAWLIREISKAQAEGKTSKPAPSTRTRHKHTTLALPYYGGEKS
ncbi:hypothetical protein FJ937_16645 [Mesorhizobium sp. B2-4-4]|uniref:hypothetical protein n=1 Tax=Mesorhizobium sp. B2-4-4 TaxID=2589945 RepID=UPI001125D8E3|nr:hypothetical protein [Mesorhizobium sp. B2-4-4]TPL49114.1 hypothetical protein FJ937_16645 [Mesorhizobium sp. B2-4-4]